VTIGLLLQPLAKPEGLTDEFEDVGLESEAVEESTGQLFAAEDLGPIGEGEVGGDNQGDPLVQGGAKLEHQLGTEGGKGDEAQFIEHDQVLFEGGAQEFLETVLLLRLGQVVDQGSGVVEANVLRWVLPRPGGPTIIIGSALAM